MVRDLIRKPLCQIHFHDKKSTNYFTFTPVLVTPFLRSWSLVMRFSTIIPFALLLNAAFITALPLQKRCVVSISSLYNCLTFPLHCIVKVSGTIAQFVKPYDLLPAVLHLQISEPTHHFIAEIIQHFSYSGQSHGQQQPQR